MKRDTKNFEQAETEDLLKSFNSGKTGIEAFKVPEGYFDALPSRIRDEISAGDYESHGHVWMKKQFASYWVWIPVLSVSLVLLAIFTWMPDKSKHETIAEIEDTLYLDQALDASYAGEVMFQEYTAVYEMLENPVLQNQEAVSFIGTGDDGITDEEIIEYLNNQELDTEVLSQI